MTLNRPLKARRAADVGSHDARISSLPLPCTGRAFQQWCEALSERWELEGAPLTRGTNMNEFQVWLIVATVLCLLVTAQCIKSLRAGRSPWTSFTRWLREAFDILSGG